MSPFQLPSLRTDPIHLQCREMRDKGKEGDRRSNSESATFCINFPEALCYMPEGRGFNSRRVHWIFNWPNPSSRTMALGSTKPLTEMSTKNLPGAKGQPALKADNLTAI
jgi:hypothetical protein